jgi:ABC-2 type transport system permease protein
MTTALDAQNMSDTDTRSSTNTVQPFAWSVRREIWEHRAIWMGPLIAAGLVLFGFLIRIFDLPRTWREVGHMPPGVQAAAVAAPFAIAAVAILVTGFIVAVFYCLGALNNERRDRSILFWKSLPVSDTTAVLAKVFIPMVAIPVVLFVTVWVAQFIMLLLATVTLSLNGLSPAVVWNDWPIARMTVVLVYLLVVTTLWYAPVYGWLLMVSSWARRMAFLWAVLPWPGLAILEKIAFGSEYVGNFINYVINGWVEVALRMAPEFQNHHGKVHMKDIPVIDPLSLLDPGHFFTTPSLYIGLVVAAAFVAAAIYFRKKRDLG